MKDVKGYEGLYAVTSCGRVWSYRSNKFLKTFVNNSGYVVVDLCKDGKRKHLLVHRLLAEAYIPNPENLLFVNHKDEVKTHNWINNLEWCTREYNNNYGTGIARSVEKRSWKIKCIETNEVFDSLKDCERKTGCWHHCISKHLQGKKGYSHVKGFHFIKI